MILIAVLILATIHSALFYFMSSEIIEIDVIFLVFTFWITITTILTSLLYLKLYTKQVIILSVFGALIILPTAEACLMWTIWSINGFAP